MPHPATYEERSGAEPDSLFQTLSKHSEGMDAYLGFSGTQYKSARALGGVNPK